MHAMADSDAESLSSFVNLSLRPRQPLRELDALGNEDLSAQEGKRGPFTRFAWSSMETEQEDEEKAAADEDAPLAEPAAAPTSLEATMRDFENLYLRAPGAVGATPAAAATTILVPNTHYDESFCYLCHTAANPQNEYREKILKMLELRDEMDPFCLCQMVANFYKNNLEEFVKRKWPASAVERHMRECSNDVGYAISRGLRVLAAYDDEYAKFATRTNAEGEPIAPDHTHVLTHLKVIDSRRKQLQLMLQYQRSRKM